MCVGLYGEPVNVGGIQLAGALPGGGGLQDERIIVELRQRWPDRPTRLWSPRWRRRALEVCELVQDDGRDPRTPTSRSRGGGGHDLERSHVVPGSGAVGELAWGKERHRVVCIATQVRGEAGRGGQQPLDVGEGVRLSLCGVGAVDGNHECLLGWDVVVALGIPECEQLPEAPAR